MERKAVSQPSSRPLSVPHSSIYPMKYSCGFFLLLLRSLCEESPSSSSWSLVLSSFHVSVMQLIRVIQSGARFPEGRLIFSRLDNQYLQERGEGHPRIQYTHTISSSACTSFCGRTQHTNLGSGELGTPVLMCETEESMQDMVKAFDIERRT